MAIHLFISDLRSQYPRIKFHTDYFTRLAKGTDASFYRLIPQVVVEANNEDEIVSIVRLCNKHRLPLTFRAGGTSLSGQTISESVLVELGLGFNTSRIVDNGETAVFGPAVVGEQANLRLSRFGRKLGPSPASIAAAKIGGIVANNASGSSYGIAHNSYHTVKSMRIIFHDGTILDTGDKQSRESFRLTHRELCDKFTSIRTEIYNQTDVLQRIRSKFELKNTCGYGMNSFVDYEDPVDMIQHLMIGSEGTLGFISELTFQTVPDYPCKATSLVFFPHIRLACEAITPLRTCSVSAAELMDRNALRAVEELPGMPEILRNLDDDTVALLIDTSADNQEDLQKQIEEIILKLKDLKTVFPIEFTTDAATYNTYWKVRKGLFTSAAATRSKGTSCIIEDLAFRADVLGDALVALQELFASYHYKGSIIWGHLLDGNIHFVIMPNFNTAEGIEEYRQFMFDLVHLTIDRFDGSLKAEHGTGRNMAPFVEKEWGEKVYGIMKRVKQAMDPNGILNPGVIINEDPDVFVKNLKPLPEVNDLIDRCIECGFCEPQCPSKNLTITPRQRILIYRQLSMLRIAKKQNTDEYLRLKESFRYGGNETCATDGLCERACPVGINTGKLIKELRYEEQSKFANEIADYMADHMAGLTSILRFWLKVPHLISKVIGYRLMEACTYSLFKISGKCFPLWTRYTPSGTVKLNAKKRRRQPSADTGRMQVVYFPTCINRTMGTSYGYENKTALVQKIEELLTKAGVDLIYPDEVHKLCCGMAFDSKGFKEQGLRKARELERCLMKASDNGRIPVLSDMSPCLFRMKETLDKRLELHDPVSYILKYLQDRLVFRQLPIEVAIHSTCSNTKMGQESDLFRLASMCVKKVLIPEEIGCCGWAGDRGFFYPELNRSALRTLKEQVSGLKYAYSTSRTCEIGLSMNSGVSYQSIVYMVDKATDRKAIKD